MKLLQELFAGTNAQPFDLVWWSSTERWGSDAAETIAPGASVTCSVFADISGAAELSFDGLSGPLARCVSLHDQWM